MKILDLEDLKRMSIEEKIEIFKQGYQLYDKSDVVSHTETLARCPSSIIKGIAKTITLSLPTTGTPPYIYKFYADGVLKHTSPSTNSSTYSLSYKFDETVGSHAYKGEVTDGCAITVSDPCTLNITEAAPAAISPWLIFGILGVGVAAYIVTKK